MNGEKKPNNILRRERLLRGWSQQKLARLVETSEDVVSRWERGERKPSPFYQEKFCILYGKTAEELGFLEPYPNQPPAIVTLVTDINQAANERLEQAESIINLAWEAWFGSRPKQVIREITKLLPALERMLNMSLASVCVLHIKELLIRCHGLLGTIYLDALQNDAAFQREVREETGLDIPIHLFQQVQTYEDFEDPRGKYVCLLYILREPLSPEARIEAGDDASRVQWYSVENLESLPYLAFNHIRLLRMALRQFFTSYYHDAAGLQEIDACQCEIENSPDVRCINTAYWRYNGIAICPKDMQLVVKNNERKCLETPSLSDRRSRP